MFLFRGRIGAAQQSASFKKIVNPLVGLKGYLKKHLLFSGMQASRLSEELVQIDSAQMQLADESRFGFYTRPLLDLWIAEKFNLDKCANEDEQEDIEKAIGDLRKYEKVYNVMKYSNDLAFGARRIYLIMLKNTSVPQSVYRASEGSSM